MVYEWTKRKIKLESAIRRAEVQSIASSAILLFSNHPFRFDGGSDDLKGSELGWLEFQPNRITRPTDLLQLALKGIQHLAGSSVACLYSVNADGLEGRHMVPNGIDILR